MVVKERLVIIMINRRTTMVVRISALLAIGALAFTGCSSSDDIQAPDDPEKTSDESAEEVAFDRDDLGDLPEDVFGDVVWAHDLGLMAGEVGFVQGDRTFVVRNGDAAGEKVLVALDADGQEAWTTDFAEDSGHFLGNHFAVSNEGGSESEGLTQTEETDTVQLLSYDDGSVTDEFDDVRVSKGWLMSRKDDGSGGDDDMSAFYDENTGEKSPYGMSKPPGGTPDDPLPVAGVPNPDGKLRDLSYHMRVPSLGLAFLSHSINSPEPITAADVDTGEVRYTFECMDQFTGGGDGSFGTRSPNGEYAVYGNVVVSADEGHCYGDRSFGERTPKLSAVDDSGLAFGKVEGDSDAKESAVMIDFGAPGVEGVLYDGAAPLGIMDGGIAVFQVYTEEGSSVVGVQMR